MDMLTITVAPAEGGWTVTAAPIAGPLVFLSGAKAERAGRRIASALASVGRRAELQVFDRQGRLVGAPMVPEPRLAWSFPVREEAVALTPVRRLAPAA